MFFQLLLNGIIMGAVYAVAALGFAFVYNTTKTFHIAYAALYALAPYLAMTGYSKLHLPFWVAASASVIAIGLLSVLIETFIYQPMEKKNSSANVIMISSIGVMIIMINLIAMIYGNEAQVFSSEISKTITIYGIILTYTQLLQFFVCIAICLLFLLFLKFSQFGLKTRALRDSAIMFQTFGHNIKKMRIYLFLFSGIFVAAASNLVAFDIGMDPYTGMSMLLNALVALIIGGVGRFHAPIIGGFIIGILQSVTIYFFSSQWQNTVVFAVLIIFLLFRPQGLVGEKQRAV